MAQQTPGGSSISNRDKAARPRRLPRQLTASNLAVSHGPGVPRRNTIAAMPKVTPNSKAQRKSKTSQKLVVLPSAPQTVMPPSDEELTHEYETDTGLKELKSEAEKMTKTQREEAGHKRITAYCMAGSFKTKLLASFLKREHNVSPRIFDEALYVMYHLPLLPGYGPNSNVRSSAPAKPSTQALSEAEEDGYQGMYFTSHTERSFSSSRDGYISSSPVQHRRPGHRGSPESPTTNALFSPVTFSDISPEFTSSSTERPRSKLPVLPTESESEPEDKGLKRSFTRRRPIREDNVAEVIFFDYGVVVFFGLDESQERSIIEDIENADIPNDRIEEKDWEIEECHFIHDPDIAYPRIYNDLFTLKSRSHLLKLSISHAMAQSTLLAQFETQAARVLSSPMTLSIPTQLAKSGYLKLKRHDALKLMGQLFKLRRDINLVSNVMDVPELFWSEASLNELYDAVREYMEIGVRVQALNEKLVVAGDFLDAIHDHLNNNAMERITWVIIWLIVVAIVVASGEVISRLAVHISLRPIRLARVTASIPKEDALTVLQSVNSKINIRQ